MSYEKREFEKLKFRVDLVDVPSYEPTQSFPEIRFYPEFMQKEYLASVPSHYYGRTFAYIVYAYDPTSPFVRYNSNILKRKKDAAKYVFTSEKNVTYIENLILNENDSVNRMISRFLRILKNSNWETLVSYQETLRVQLEMLRKGKDLDEKAAETLIKTTTSLRREIEILEKDFLVNDDNYNLRSVLYDIVETEDLDLTPERVAIKAKIGEKPSLFNPYDREIHKKDIKDFIRDNMEKLLKGDM